jgi:hypothetical protein
MDKRIRVETVLVPDALPRKRNKLSCQFGASDIPAHGHGARSIVTVPGAVERPRQRFPDFLILRMPQIYSQKDDVRHFEPVGSARPSAATLGAKAISCLALDSYACTADA